MDNSGFPSPNFIRPCGVLYCERGIYSFIMLIRSLPKAMYISA